jgi:hypothetical protein
MQLLAFAADIDGARWRGLIYDEGIEERKRSALSQTTNFALCSWMYSQFMSLDQRK